MKFSLTKENIDIDGYKGVFLFFILVQKFNNYASTEKKRKQKNLYCKVTTI